MSDQLKTESGCSAVPLTAGLGVCTCPTECDCQAPERGLCSNECPEHNLTPYPALTCPAHGETI